MKKLLLMLLTLFILSCGGEQETIFIDYSTAREAVGLMSPSEIFFEYYTGDMPDYYGKIVDVADGDTFYVDWFSEDKMGVRVKGIDTPETKDKRKDVQYWGPEASEYAKSVLKPGTIVRLKFEGNITGPFGRLLAYVWYWNGDEWKYWNKEVLESGMGFVYADYEFEYPNEFMEYQKKAQDAELGIWKNPELIDNDVVRSKEEFAEREYWYRKRYY